MPRWHAVREPSSCWGTYTRPYVLPSPPQELNRGDSVRVRMSENPVPTINKTDLTGDWFDSLERCFRWSDRSVQKPLPLEGQDGGAPGSNGS